MASKPEDDIRTELLGLLGEEFDRAGIPNSLLPPTLIERGVVAPAQLVIPLGEPDDQGPVIHLYFLPGLEQPAVAQFMVLLGYEVAAGAEAALARFIALVNANLPLTGFEYSETLAQVVFRHTQTVATAPLDPGVLAWPLSMIRFAVEEFGPLVRNVAAGGSLSAASAGFERLIHEPESP